MIKIEVWCIERAKQINNIVANLINRKKESKIRIEKIDITIATNTLFNYYVTAQNYVTEFKSGN